MEYTSKFKGSQIDSILESVGNPADSPSSDGSAFGRINQLAVDLEKAGSSDEVMRKIYTSYGAVYNAESNTYTLNEVTLTPDEMYNIYIKQNMWDVRENIIEWCSYGETEKTNIAPKKGLDSAALGCRVVFVCYINNNVETFCLSSARSDAYEQGWLVTNISYSFMRCSKLRKIIGRFWIGSATRLTKDVFSDLLN